VVLGGGHDIAFGHYLGITRQLLSSKRLGILNFDAHLDLRPLRPIATSGTMFTQIASECRERGTDFSSFCIGTQKSANTVSLFRIAEELGVEIVLAKDMDDADLEPVKKKIDAFLAGNDAIYVTICADVFSSALAPGVSAPQPFGLHPEPVLRLLKHVLASGGEEEIDGEPLLVPLAVPLIAGPSLLAVLLLFATAEPGRTVDLLLAAGLAWLATFVVLFASTFLFRFLTKRGLVAVERLMGMVLVALAVQLFLDGLSKYLK